MSELKIAISAEIRRWLAEGCAVIDTETTGFGPDAEIVEFSAISASGKVLLDTLIKPVRPIPDEVIKIHGITNEMVANAPTWADVHDHVMQILASTTPVIWNAAYDTRLIRQTAALYNQASSELDALLSSSQCAMLHYAEYWGEWDDYRGGYRWQRLQYAAQQQGIEIDGQAHRALCDVKTTLGVMRAVAASHLLKPESFSDIPHK